MAVKSLLEMDIEVRALWKTITKKQRELVRQYLKTGNKLASYKKAYYPDGDWEERITTAALTNNCYVLFRHKRIKLLIEKIQELAVLQAQITVPDEDEGPDEPTEEDGAINDALRKLNEENEEYQAAKIDAFWVLRKLSLLANFNIRSFIRVDDNGNAIYDFSNATEDDWYCIQEYTVEEIARGQNEDKYFVDKLKIKTYDKLRALEMIGRHTAVNAFKDVQEMKFPDGIPVMGREMSDEDWAKIREKMLNDSDC